MTVPRFPDAPVQQAPLPGVRVPTDVPAAAFGVPSPLDLHPLQASIQEIAQRELQKTNEVRVLDADNQITQLRNQLLYNPEGGVLALRGKDAINAQQGFESAWAKGIAEIRNGLGNDQQQFSFDHLASSQYARANEEVQAHVSAQRQSFEEDTVNGALDNAYNDAIHNAANPDAVAQSIVKSQAIAQDWGRRNGNSPEQIQSTVAKVTSRAHLGVVQTLFDAGNDSAGAAYFAAHQADLVGTDLNQAERLAQAGSLRGASQQRADAIFGSTSNLDDALTAARAIQEPNLRDQTEDRIRQRYQDQAAAARASDQAAHDQVWKTLQQNGGNFEAVPLSLRQQLNDTDYTRLKAEAENLRNPRETTDTGVWAHLINLASLNDSTRAQFAALDLSDPQWRKSLSPSDFVHITDVQASVRDQLRRGVATADAAAKRKQEAAVLKASGDAAKKIAAAAMMEQASPGSSKYLPRPAAVTVPQWMLDSASVDPDYAGYLRLHGVNVNAGAQGTPAPAPAHPAGILARPAPKAPGAPIGPSILQPHNP